MLYDFQTQHPDTDIQPYLEKSSQYFQNYIERGLQRIQNERNATEETRTETNHVVTENNNVCIGKFHHPGTFCYIFFDDIMRKFWKFDRKKNDIGSKKCFAMDDMFILIT